MSVIFSCSIDDGHPSDLKMAELLNKHRLNGTFYIPIKNREGLPVMQPAQIRDVGAQFEIGSHTLDHCFLSTVGQAQAQVQILEGKKQLEDLLGRLVSGFCYPGGKYGQENIAQVKESGFSYARTTVNLCFSTGTAPFEMPTTCQFYPHQRSVYVRNFIKGGHWSQRTSGLAKALQSANWMDRLYGLFDHACLHGSVFHLWCHSHDLDQLNAWADLDRFLAYVAAKVEPHRRLNNAQLAELI